MDKPDEADKMNRTSTVGRRIAGSVGGLVVGGAAVGGGIFCYLLSTVPEYDSNPDETAAWSIILSVLGFFVGGTAGAAAGATVVQKFLRQRSSFWKALLGTFVGLLIGGFLALSPGIVTGWEGSVLDALTVLASMVAGAVIGSGWKAKAAAEVQS